MRLGFAFVEVKASPRYLDWLVVAMIGIGCSSSSAGPSKPAQNPDAGQSHPNDGGATPDSGAPTVQGGYSDGVYQCCAPGAGENCCDDYAQGQCYSFGGIYGDCRQVGELIEGKVTCAICCEGLVRVAPQEPSGEDPSECVSKAPPSVFQCVPCGDNRCEPPENHCNCPKDCP